MPVISSVGYSKSTPLKTIAYGSLLNQLFSIYSKMDPWVRQNGFLCIDATAGNASNPAWPDEETSATQLLNLVADSPQLNCHVHLIDKEKENCDQLKEHPLSAAARIHNSKFEEAIPVIVSRANNRMNGFIYLDKNGGITQDEHESLSRTFQHPNAGRIDFIWRCGANSLKRAYKHRGLMPSDIKNGVNKKYWLITKPESKWQWVFLVGSNYPINPWKEYGFMDINSDMGKRAFIQINNIGDDVKTEMEKIGGQQYMDLWDL
jgi:hypothetical protein